MDLFGKKAQARLAREEMENFNLRIALKTVEFKYYSLLKEWNKLINRINALGGESFLEGKSKQSSQFTQDEIRTLIRLCHPDKHAGSAAANEMTQKLLKMRN